MKPFFRLTLAFLLFLLTATSFAKQNPMKDPLICGRPTTCIGSGKFKYGPGTQQNYKYSVDVRSSFNGTSKNESSLYIDAVVTLNFLTPCDGLLTLENVRLSNDAPTIENNNEQLFLHANSDAFAGTLSEYSLRFSFNDGIISEICPQEDEKTWVLNFKRGLLSMLHNTMKRFDLDHSTTEEDVKGKCPTSYVVKGAKETSLIIEKTKDLTSCQNRAKLHSMVQSVPYNFRSDVDKEKGLLKSSSTCEMSIDHNIYNNVICKESHILQPFSKEDAGATTIVSQRLILLGESNNTLDEQAEINRRTTLLFDHVLSPKQTQNELKTSKDLIRKMCKQSKDDVQIEFSDLFTKFIQTLRLLSYPSLSDLYEGSSKLCFTGKKHLLDALPYVGTSESVVVMKDIILKGQVHESTVEEWLMSVAFIPRPNEQMMETASQLLRQLPFDTSIAFSVTSLTYTFCTQHSSCINKKSVREIVDNIGQTIIDISNDKRLDDRHNKDKIIVALKSLGNIGVVPDDIKSYLVRIIEDSQIDGSIRVAAVEAYRRLPCTEKRSYFESLFRNSDEDVEVRIAAYLQLMQCPDYLLIRTIKHCLENEQVNQVGSFVWSHLNNLMKSSIPSRVEIQGLLADLNLVRKFSSDVRKFSHHTEGSIFFEEYDMGANYDSNVIFSPASYVPKSAMLNLTVDIFGQSINMVEFYGRFEGFEHYLESIFGPKGSLNSDKVKEEVSKMRWSRSAPDNNNRGTGEDENLKNAINKLPNVMENLADQPKVSLGFKVFGNDLKYGTFDGIEEIKAALQTLNPLDHLKRILSGKEINYNKAAMFLDSQYVVPTGAGLPISLNALGTTSINLKLSGSLHASNFAKTKELDLKADIRPSISVDLTGAMFVDAFYTSTGIKLKSSMYTSSAIEGNIKIRGNKLVSVKFSIPRQTSEIFGAKFDLIVMQHDVEQLQSGLSNYRLSKSICSWPAVDKTVGLKLCGEYHFINVTKMSKSPYFILAGPSGLRLFLEKSDPTAKIYIFEYKMSEKKDLSFVSLTFDTPGSTFSHLLAANFTIDKQSQNLTMVLQSTEGTVEVKGRYKNTDNEKLLELFLIINKQNHFDINLSLTKEPSRHGFLYQPKFYLGINNERIVDLHGSVKLVSKNGISQYDVDLKFQTKRLKSKLFGYVSKRDASFAANLMLDYVFAKSKEQRVIFLFSLANRSSKNILYIRGSCNLVSTAYPDYNFETELSFQRGTGHIESKFELTSSPLPKTHPDAELHKLKLVWILSDKSAPDSSKKFQTSLSINRNSSDLNINGLFALESKSPAIIQILTFIEYAKDKQVSVDLFWSNPRTVLTDFQGRANVTIPTFTPMIAEVQVVEKNSSIYIVKANGTWFSGHNGAAYGLYSDKSTSRTQNRILKLNLRSPISATNSNISTVLHFYRNENQLKVDLQAEMNNTNYGISINHARVSPSEISTQANLTYETKLYSVSSHVSLGDYRRIEVDFHIDQMRDIHFEAWENNAEMSKAAGLELKWDANRNNEQKFVISGNFTKLKSLNYTGNLLISYPGRTILSNFDFLLQDGYFYTLARLSWADQQSFAVILDIKYQIDQLTFVEVTTIVATPFKDWQKTEINGGYHHQGNMYRLNGSIFWKHSQQISFDLFEDYAMTDAAFECKLKSSLTSTLSHIPTFSVILTHNHNTSKVDSLLNIRYEPEQIIDIESNWKIDRAEQHTNLTGIITATTPFVVCKRGYLISKIHYTKFRYIRGYGDLDLDHKKFTVNLEGNLKKLTNSMVTVNITTPIEKYKQMQGRFGFSEDRKHLVAQITYPTAMIGFEILLEINELTDFDIILSLATPITFLQQIFLIAKLKPETADFRAGWNSIILGFTGVWHYVNVIDLEYSYKIYTPIDGFEENGIVTKLIFKEGLDFEVSIRLSQHKLGIAVNGQPKPKILKELGIKTHTIYNIRLNKRKLENEDFEENSSDEDNYYDEDSLNWTGFIEIDAVVYPTIQGTLEIDQEGHLYIIQSKLSLPHGTAIILDEFEFISTQIMRNDLKITTPYPAFNTITSLYNLELLPGHKYELELSLNYQNRTKWVDTSIFGLFTTDRNAGTSEGSQMYNVTLEVHSPFETLPKLMVQGTHNSDAHVYRTNLSVSTNTTDLVWASKAKIVNQLFDAVVFTKVKTPSFEIPPTNIALKKNFEESDNSIEAHINVERLFKKEIYLKANWLYKSLKQCYIFIRFETPFKGLEESVGGGKLIVTDKGVADAWLTLKLHPLDINVNSTLTENTLTALADINFNQKLFPTKLTLTITKNSLGKGSEFQGELLLKDKPFDVKGYIDTIGNMPIDSKISLIPIDGSAPLNFEYNLKTKGDSSYIARGSFKHGEKFTNYEAEVTLTDRINWHLDLKVDTSHDVYNKFIVQGNASTDVASSYISIEAQTPIPKLENPKFGASVSGTGPSRHCEGYFELTEAQGKLFLDWTMIFLENMLVKAIGSYKNPQFKSQSHLEGFYVNPNKSFKFIKLGGDINRDNLWSAGSNVTLSIPNYENMNLEAHMKLPTPIKEVYSLAGNLLYDRNFRTVEYLVKYYTAYSEKNYGSNGNILLPNETRFRGDVKFEWNKKSINNLLDLQKSENKWKALYKLRTPKFVDKETLVTEIMYSNIPSDDAYHNITCQAFYPEKNSVAFAKVDFKAFANMNGTANITIPYRNFTYIGAHFATKTNPNIYQRHIEIFWPNNTALIDCNCKTISGVSVLESNTTGSLIIEVPLATRHIADVQFDYQKWLERSVGHTKVDYNGNKVLEGKYNCLSESRGGLDKDTIHVEVQNKLVPVGADYVHGYEYGVPRDGFSAPTVDTKHLHLYHLTNMTKFNISGNVRLKKTSTGREFSFSTTSSNRTVKISTDYDVLDQQIKQHSRIELDPSHWIEYDLDLLNKTVDELADVREAKIKVSYPKREFSGKASYNLSETSLSTDVYLIWDEDNKTVQAEFDWNHVNAQREEVEFKIKHPSFEKDVTFFGEFERNEKKLVETQLTVDYSLNPEQIFKFGGRINNNCEYQNYNYSYNIWSRHDASPLYLKTYGEFFWDFNRYSAKHFTNYKRSYLPMQTTEAMARINIAKNEFEMKRQDLGYLTYVNYKGSYPRYNVNVSTERETNNASGVFYLNFEEKLVELNYNMTADGTQSLHMYGVIPDARSAMFDIWRDYEDIRVSDVAYYLCFNHSRLITSSLLWRPELKQYIQTEVRSSVEQLYRGIFEGINNSTQYIRSEINETIHGIWIDANPLVEHFLEDLRNVKVIRNDFEELKDYIYVMYEANEFYTKDIVNITMSIFDELALKSHFESLPSIVSEIWELMGASGTKIKQSIQWVIEKIKTYYQNTTNFINGLLDGNPIDYLNDASKSIVEQFDAFIKNLHVNFIQYIENLRSQISTLIENNWHKTLAAIEPAFLTTIHHVETIVWDATKDFLDLFYKQQKEIIESPYFVKFANFTRDVDRFYKDITGNNTINSVIKYTKKGWNFLKELFLNKVPFGKELLDVVSEVVEELNELRKLPSIMYIEKKWDEFSANVKWLYDYFDMDMRLQHVIILIQHKIFDTSETALETENRYRVAKTKFIFEPSDGIMLLEQKLPMSWHAFNETPKYHEIPELRTIYKIYDYVESSHTSFWDFYYQYKPYTETSSWLPPFKAQALLVGSRYYVTFDRKYYDFLGGCSYLLATDYVDRNFSIALSYDNSAKTHELLLLINNVVVHVNLLTDSIEIDGKTVALPMQIGPAFLYREDELFIADSPSDYKLQCNLVFDICVFEVSGWYFGKTAGLWGTINNEPSDDFFTSNRTKVKENDLQDFTNSWSLGSCKNDQQQQHHRSNYLEDSEHPPDLDPQFEFISELCDEFFISQLSQLTTCFPRVSKEPFLAMCLNSSSEKEACSSALAYINLCDYSNIPLRIPDVCVKCNSLNGTQLNEGQFIRLDGHHLPNTTDIVFIIEAKDCNTNLRVKKNFDFVIESIEKELNDINILNNRYAIVVFGGSNAFDEPRSVVIGGEIFTNAKNILNYFDAIKTGNGTTDIFNAITFAKKLLFRPAVSKNFILMPCSECRESFMKLDYAIIHQLLVESDVTLHILMNEEFSLSKMRENKIPFGIDLKHAYTKKDVRRLIGDVALKKQVGLPKSTLGYCMPLALETNGSVFSSKTLESDKRGNVQKFAIVFGKRVAESARPSKCVDCECTAFDTGVSYMDCYPCTYPIRANIDYGFDDDNGTFLLRAGDYMF